MNYFNIFFFFSILGHGIESLLTKDYTSGILYGFWTPIYGVGTVLILLLWQQIKKRVSKKWMAYLLLFVLSAIGLSILEFVSGILIQESLHKVFWNYQNHFGHIGHYTSLVMSFVWGIASLFVAICIEPLAQKYSNKIPKPITYLLLGLFLVDCLVTIYNRIIAF